MMRQLSSSVISHKNTSPRIVFFYFTFLNFINLKDWSNLPVVNWHLITSVLFANKFEIPYYVWVRSSVIILKYWFTRMQITFINVLYDNTFINTYVSVNISTHYCCIKLNRIEYVCRHCHLFIFDLSVAYLFISDNCFLGKGFMLIVQ